MPPRDGNTVKPEKKLTPLCRRVAHDVHYNRARFERLFATHAQVLVHLKFTVHLHIARLGNYISKTLSA